MLPDAHPNTEYTEQWVVNEIWTYTIDLTPFAHTPRVLRH
jgi:hypothetical protein